jgi:glycosyltransferase involved in cell wall biosynthesis
VITVSETSRRDLLNLTSLRPAQLKVVHNGVPAMEVPPASARLRILRRLKIEPPYLLYAGSYEPRKNLLRAVEAYGEAAVQRDLPPLVLLVERESGHRERTVRAIEAGGLSRRLRWVHSLSEDELAVVYAEATLLLYPSLYEGFGFPPLQAMALGIPVIASDRGSLPEILGRAAHYVEPTSTSSIREAILSIVGDDGHASALAAAGRQQARLYRWETAARQTRAVYQEVAQARAAAALAPSV